MYRLSPSLLDSFDYFLSVEDEEKSREARQQILDNLAGKRTSSPEMQRGIDFERDVVALNSGKFEAAKDQAYNKCVAEIAGLVAGAICQHHVFRQLGDVIVHGYIDFLLGNRIIDVKTTGNYEVGKYRSRNQHLVYLYCLEENQIDKFTYLVTDFRNVYREDYTWRPSLADTLRANIAKLFDYLKNDTEMLTLFENKNHEIEGDENAIQIG